MARHPPPAPAASGGHRLGVSPSTLRRGLATLLAGLLTTLPSVVLGQDEVSLRRAQAHVDLGADFFREGRYEAAIEEFQQASRLVPLPDYAYYIARCHEMLGHEDQALDLYRDYLTAADDSPRADKARAAIRRLAATLHGAIRVRCEPPGARVQLEGFEQRGCPATWEGLGPGRHRLAVWAEQHSPLAVDVDVVAGETVDVPVKLTLLPGRISIRSTTTGGTAWLDGIPVGPVPAGPVEARSGIHAVVVQTPGCSNWTMKVVVSAGEDVTVMAAPVAVPGPPHYPSAPAPAPPAAPSQAPSASEAAGAPGAEPTANGTAPPAAAPWIDVDPDRLLEEEAAWLHDAKESDDADGALMGTLDPRRAARQEPESASTRMIRYATPVLAGITFWLAVLRAAVGPLDWDVEGQAGETDALGWTALAGGALSAAAAGSLVMDEQQTPGRRPLFLATATLGAFTAVSAAFGVHYGGVRLDELRAASACARTARAEESCSAGDLYAYTVAREDAEAAGVTAWTVAAIGSILATGVATAAVLVDTGVVVLGGAEETRIVALPGFLLVRHSF